MDEVGGVVSSGDHIKSHRAREMRLIIGENREKTDLRGGEGRIERIWY